MIRWLKIFSLLFLITLLTGCYDIDVTYHRDGSGEMTFILPKEETFDTREFKKNLTELNKKAGKEVVRFLNVVQTPNQTKLSVSFKKVDYLFEDKALFYGRYSEFAKKNPERIKSVRNLQGKLIASNRLESNLCIAFHDAKYIGKATVRVPGKVIYISEKAKVLNRNTVAISSGFGFVIFQPTNYYIWILGGILLILAIIGGLIFIRIKKLSSPDKS